MLRVESFDVTAAAKSLQSCPTLCDRVDGSPPGSPVPGILQARTLEWVAISFSNSWKWKVKVKSLSWVWLIATPRTAAYQAPPSMGFSRQEYWSNCRGSQTSSSLQIGCLAASPPAPPSTPTPCSSPRNFMPATVCTQCVPYSRGLRPLDLKPHDLRWIWCNNNRNKVHNR